MARLKANEEKENEEKKAVSEERPQPMAEMNSKEKKEKEEKKAESEEASADGETPICSQV